MSFSERDLRVIEEYEARKSALADPVLFRIWMAKSDLIDWVHSPAAHHLAMLEIFKWWLDTPSAKLLITLPFGSGKTVYTSVQLPTWLWALDPTKNILCASNTQDFAESLGRRRRDAIDTKEFTQLSGAELRSDSKSVREFTNTKGGIQRSVGVSASCTGFRSDYNLCDDPHVSFEQMQSRKYRDECYSWYTGIFRSRLSPGGRELICTTRFSDDDLAGRLVREEGDDWRILRIPEIADSESDPLNRDLGERLWPEYLSKDRLLIKERNPILWLGAYQQKPPAESGTWLSLDDLPIVEERPKGLKIYLAMDLALSVGQGDFSVIMTAGLDPNGDLYILDMWRQQVAVDDVAEKLTATCKVYSPELILIDDDNASKVFKTYAMDHFRRGAIYAPLKELKTMGQAKEVRAASIRGFCRQGRVKLVRADWNSVLLEETLAFPVGRNDDAVDCLSLLGRYLARMAPGEVPVQPTAMPPVQSSIIQDEHGRMTTASTLDELYEANDEPHWKKSIIRL